MSTAQPRTPRQSIARMIYRRASFRCHIIHQLVEIGFHTRTDVTSPSSKLSKLSNRFPSRLPSYWSCRGSSTPYRALHCAFISISSCHATHKTSAQVIEVNMPRHALPSVSLRGSPRDKFRTISILFCLLIADRRFVCVRLSAHMSALSKR